VPRALPPARGVLISFGTGSKAASPSAGHNRYRVGSAHQYHHRVVPSCKLMHGHALLNVHCTAVQHDDAHMEDCMAQSTKLCCHRTTAPGPSPLTPRLAAKKERRGAPGVYRSVLTCVEAGLVLCRLCLFIAGPQVLYLLGAQTSIRQSRQHLQHTHAHPAYSQLPQRHSKPAEGPVWVNHADSHVAGCREAGLAGAPQPAGSTEIALVRWLWCFCPPETCSCCTGCLLCREPRSVHKTVLATRTCCPVQSLSKLSKPACLNPCPGTPAELPSANARIQLITCTWHHKQQWVNQQP
jgi:hypothetical protein